MIQDFSNLKIQKIIAHEVFRPTDNGATEPILSDCLIKLDQEGLSELQERLTNVLGHDSKSTPMEIVDKNADSCFYFCQNSINTESDFILNSKKIANKHTSIHLNKGWPSGLLVVIQATITSSDIPCVFIVKAEQQSGYDKVVVDSNITLNFLKNLFLTPQSKLYKVGVFIFSSMNHSAILFDSNRSAAQYFYQAFLGLRIPETNKTYTKQFFDLTTQFIQNLDIPDEEKIEYQQALYNELKINKKEDFHSSEFAEKTFTHDQAENFLEFLDDKEFPTHAIVKDITLIAKHLQIRKLKFSSDVRISAPSDKFDTFVKIIASNDEETTVKIKGKLDNQTGK